MMPLGNQNNDNSDDNPFSFKKFITKKSNEGASNVAVNQSNEVDDDDDDNDDLSPPPAIANNNRSKGKSSTVAATATTANPFSFKHFLHDNKSSRAQIPEQKSTLMNDNDSSDDDDEIVLPSIGKAAGKEPVIITMPPPPSLSPPLNLIKTPIPNAFLPDFINESIYPNGNATASQTFEDPYLVLENIPNIALPGLNDLLPPVITPTSNTSSYFDLESNLPSSSNYEVKSSLNDQLPSYFDLETKLGASSISGKKNSRSEINDEFELTAASRQSSEYYQRQLVEKHKIIEEQERKLEQYQKEMSEIKKKEVQETKTLENIIQDIEKNLEKTTIRAIEAENLVDKLKGENKGLKVQVQNLVNENELLKLNNNSSSNVRQMLGHYSEQLTQAASSGEQIIKQLLGGVDTLKLLAQSLESVGKIQEVNNETTK